MISNVILLLADFTLRKIDEIFEFYHFGRNFIAGKNFRWFFRNDGKPYWIKTFVELDIENEWEGWKSAYCAYLMVLDTLTTSNLLVSQLWIIQ